MELQSQLNGESSEYFSNKEYDTNNGNNILVSDFKLSPLRTDGNSNPYCNYWLQSHSGSYAMDARIRLETLKSGSSSPVPNRVMNGSMYSYDFSKDIWETEQNELSVLDSVDLLDVEEREEDEESWLYVSPKKLTFVGKTESALRWCRHVLDNRSPEMEAACLKLTNRLNLKLSCESRHPGLQQPGTLSFDLSMDQTSFGCRASSNTFDHIDQSISPESNYKLQNITDIYDTARIQEACLRQENFYTFRCHKSPWTLPLCSDTTTNNITHRNRTEASSCTASVPMNQSARMITENCLSPKVTRLHEYKMLKRAQNQGASSRSSSPMHTSLRSLQAVRSSRSLDIDDYNLDQILHIRAGASSARTDSSYRSVSHSAHHMKPAQPTAIKRCQRSHSLSPCRIPHSSISSVERVFAPLKNRGAAWFQNGRQVQR